MWRTYAEGMGSGRPRCFDSLLRMQNESAGEEIPASQSEQGESSRGSLSNKKDAFMASFLFDILPTINEFRTFLYEK